MTRRAAKIDANQTSIVQALRKMGFLVLSLARVSFGAPDLLVYSRAADRYWLLEIKVGKNKLRPQQVAFRDDGWKVDTIRTFDDLAAVMKVDAFARLTGDRQ